MTRILAAVVLAAASIGAVQTDPAYKVVGKIPDRDDGRLFRTFDTDRTTNRVYMGSDRGLYWLDLADPERVKGPIFDKDILKIELAQDTGRLFYFTKDEVGYCDVRTTNEPKTMRDRIEARAMAYEPTKRELYVATRDPYLTIFDGTKGEFGFRLQLEAQSWFGTQLEGAPGRVYAQVGGKQGLFVIDAATHKISPWPVKGVVTPAYMEADPEGQYLFVTWDRYVAAIDARDARIIERVVAHGSSIAYDPGSKLLINSWIDVAPPLKITVYRVDAKGLSVVSKLENPDIGLAGVEPTNRGFLQRANTNLLVWAFQGK